MASLRRKDRSPFWFACFTLPDGRRTQRSTGAADRRKAQRVANEFEDAAREASAGRFIESRARRTIADILAIGNGDKLKSSLTGDFLEDWLGRKAKEADESTHTRYTSVVSKFKEFLGPKSKRDLTSITAADFTRFRDELLRRVAAGTVNLSLKILRAAFRDARRDGLIDVNEAERVTSIKRPVRLFKRRPFTLDELRKILSVADKEWRGLILFGLYTGQRLGDLASLTYQNVHVRAAELHLVTAKTDSERIIPLARPLRVFVKKLPAGAPGDPIFPRAFATAERQQRVGNLSNQFYSVLVAAGLASKRTHKSTDKGRDCKRERNALSFHCLRHTLTSLLKSAGAGEAVAMEFVGHDSPSISQHYTHIETAALKRAAAKLPDVTK